MATEIILALSILAGVCAGVVWSTLGIWSKWRSGEESSVDGGKLLRNVIVGAGTGFAAFIFGILTGFEVGTIESFRTFVLATGGYFPIVVAVDKLLVSKQEI